MAAPKFTVKQKRLLTRLTDCHTVVEACKKAEVAESTYYNWMKSNPDFKKAVDDTAEARRDLIRDVVTDLSLIHI